MDLTIWKKLLEENILDFHKLLMRYYREVGLSETDMVILSELFRQSQKGNTYLSLTKLGKNLTISKEELMKSLEGFIQNKYLSIRLIKNTQGKETEAFDLDGTLEKIIEKIEDDVRSEMLQVQDTFTTPEEEIAHIVETNFHKQLKPLDVEMIQRWIHSDNYEMMEIKQALLDALKANRFTMSYVDTALIKRRKQNQKTKTDVVYDPKKSEALKTFFDSLNQHE